MKILSWNIQHGGGSRVQSILKEIKIVDSDIVILTEFRNSRNGNIIKNELFKYGYHNQHINLDLSENLNSVAVFSKIKFTKKSVPEEISKGVIKVCINNIDIYAMYFPQKTEKDLFFRYIIKSILDKKNNNLFIGDFNTGKNNLDKDDSGANFYCAKRLSEIEGLNHIDCWRYFNHDKREYTWYSQRKGVNHNGFRVDHAFISLNKIDTLQNCSYKHSVRTERISDHSILLLELNFF